jgi:hypothetical protein
MTDDELRRCIQVQQAISERLAEFGYADHDRAARISRDMAEIVVKGRTFAEHTVPLFLQIPRDNPVPVAQVALAIKVQLEELTDALEDLRHELPDWAEFFSELAGRNGR